MPTKPCPNPYQGSQIIAQTLFLGASVNSFNTSMGWGGQPSQLTVTLVDDIATSGCLLNDNKIASQLPLREVTNGALQAASDTNDIKSGGRFPADHYHTCDGDNCYVDIKGKSFSSSTMDVSQRMVPGKVYYGFDVASNDKVFKSSYWYNPDPGFFGKPNHITVDNRYTNTFPNATLSNLNRGYDIIDTPVLFKFGNFTFGGLVQSWNEQLSQGGRLYTVTINSMQALLNSCYIILGAYAGAVYSKKMGSTALTLGTFSNNSIYAGPRNYTGHEGVDYFGKIYEGNLPNVFNVYGFLESFGLDGFGGSRITDEGISANAILDALSILTSCTKANKSLNYHNSNVDFNSYGARLAYSPFGRIIAKCMQEYDTYATTTIDRFGVIPRSVMGQEAGNPVDRCSFTLDLSEIPRFPNDYRISGGAGAISITDLLNRLSEAGGFDYYVELIPVKNAFDNKIENVIKVKTISRLAQPRTYEIQNTINLLKCNNYPISALTVGKEKNDTAARSVIIGGPVQRLYQAKSYRLAYTQSNFIYDPYLKKFIDYMQLGYLEDQRTTRSTVGTKQFFRGKIKTPSALDLHNPVLSRIINPTYGIYDHNDDIKKSIPYLKYAFNDIDDTWGDDNQLGTGLPGQTTGNYGEATILKHQADSSDISQWGTHINQRFFPLFMDVICPFFGFSLDNRLDIQTDGKHNDFRRVRPVWFDTWTGQIVVLLRTEELPQTSVNLTSNMILSGISHFILTESEIRAAIAGFDEFVVYCLSKTYKPELIEMLRRAHILKAINKYKAEGMNDNDATELANTKHNWYWKLMGSSIQAPGSNIMGPFRLTSAPAPVKIDNSHNIDQAALRDLQMLHEFVAKIGEFYGKKYMVIAPYLSAYKDDEFSRIILPTHAGNAYVFQGGGGIHYSYEPTNDGAWEEYGNIIDDCIAVGSKEWNNLVDERGKIKPLLGYNANEALDIAAYNICKLNNDTFQQFQQNKLNPFWSFKMWDYLKDNRDNSCDPTNFIYPTLNYSSLSSDSYQIIDVSGISSLPSVFNQLADASATITIPQLTRTPATVRDAFGTELDGLKMHKLFVTTEVDESFVFLDPDNLKEPRILINGAGLYLNSSSNLYAQDPNSTIVANIAMEDLLLYLNTTLSSDVDIYWVNYMLSYVYSVLNDAAFFAGGSSTNRSAGYASLSPKAAHPFFAGIPIKSNIYNYGPWTNYPYLEYLSNPNAVFPSGTKVNTNDDLPPVCSIENVVVTQEQAKNAIDNWILPTNVTIEQDYVPWNYGGMAFLDTVAIDEARKQTNYQNVLETAQIDMPGYPLFNLGGSFSYGNWASTPTVISGYNITLIDNKYNQNNPLANVLNNLPLPIVSAPFISPTVQDTLIYTTLVIPSYTNTGSPVVTNIQVNSSQGGITTTYSFRTYTKKLGLFNKENSDNIKQMHLNNIKRNKQLSKIQSQFNNSLYSQSRNLQNKQLSSIKLNSKEFGSKLYGWSPVKVLIAQASPYAPPLIKSPDAYATVVQSYAGSGQGITRQVADKPSSFKVNYGNDPGDDIKTWRSQTSALYSSTTLQALSATVRYRTDVGLFEEKEVDAQIANDYGLQSMMSLDGIFSPVSFYPTYKNSTFNFGLYQTQYCPFCSGTKKIYVNYIQYLTTGYGGASGIDIYCDKCVSSEEALNIKLKSSTTSRATSQSLETLPPYIISSGTDISILTQYAAGQNITTTTVSSNSTSSSNTGGQAGVSIPINMVSLNPIVVPYGEFKNPNIQNYSGIHPDNIHDDLTVVSPAFSETYPRTFFDRCRHSIEVIGRGSVKPEDINITTNLKNYTEINGGDYVNADFYNLDIRLSNILGKRGESSAVYQNNQRFLGLRGPLVLHAWGYDLEGYPVPNAADEPYAIDEYNRPRRFKIKITDTPSTPYSSLNKGDVYLYNNTEYIQGFSDPEGITDNTQVTKRVREDDLDDAGGFDPITYQGSIISKTQKYDTKWSEKKKLKEFYLNWAERPDIWPVGPIDLRWDNDRKVWATKADGGSASIYKMVYVTLEEDLVKDDDVEETYPARGFLDDLEYSTQPLDLGLRRLVFIKDRAGYTAPRGAKLLCRYDKDTGFYEPVSKQIFVALGTITPGTNIATIEMAYAPGKKRGEANPTMMVNFENSFGLPTTQNKGLFTFINSKWVLTTSQ